MPTQYGARLNMTQWSRSGDSKASKNDVTQSEFPYGSRREFLLEMADAECRAFSLGNPTEAQQS